MMRNRFDEQLNELNSEMIRMGALCEEVIALAAKALDEGDRALAKKVAPAHNPAHYHYLPADIAASQAAAHIRSFQSVQKVRHNFFLKVYIF